MATMITGAMAVAAGGTITAVGGLGLLTETWESQAKTYYEGINGAGSSVGSWEYDALKHAYISNTKFLNNSKVHNELERWTAKGRC